jgi:hypothetical protein
MELANGVSRVADDRSPTMSHFLRRGKFSGISGSSCPSQPTMPAERSVTGRGANAMRVFLERVVPVRETMLMTRETLLLTLLRDAIWRSETVSWCS